MAAFQKESGSVTSRDWSSNGWCGKFKAWVVKSYGAGGPLWYIIDDQSGLATDPYIVVCNQSSPTWDSIAKIIQVKMVTSTELVQISYWMWWNTSTHVGSNLWHQACLTTQTSSFVYDFRGGPEILFMASRIGTSIYWSFVDEWDPIATLCESTSRFGTLTAKAFLETGDTNNQLSGYERLSGYKANLDGNGKLYFSANFSAGTLNVNIYKDSARTQLIGHTTSANGSLTTTGLKSVAADNASGLGGFINYDAIGSSSNTGIACRFNRLDLGSGEGAAVTVGKPYYIYDRTGATAIFGYFIVEAKSGDQIQIDALSSDINTGAIIGPYLHPWTSTSSHYGATGGNGNNMSIPYMSQPDNPFASRAGGASDPRAGHAWMSVGGVDRMNPDDEQRFAVMRPLIYEFSQTGSTSMNRAYGRTKNTYTSSPTGLAIFQDGRLINGNQWLYFWLNTSAFLIRDYTSLS